MGLSMHRHRRVLAWVIATSVTAYLSLSAYAIANQDIEELLVCADRGGMAILFAKTSCRTYLFSLRGSEADIDALHRGIGASFIVQGVSQREEKERTLEFLIAKGLDINRIDAHQLTPLHGAVLANSLEEVDILLRHGARADIKDARFGLTALELAVKLQTEDAAQAGKRTAVVERLRTAR